MAFLAAEDQKAQFLKSLDKGQVPTLAGIKDQFSTSFILDGVRYNIAVTLATRDLLVLRLNDLHIVVCAHALPDSGVLVTYAEMSHVTYASANVAGTQLPINGRTMVFTQGTDPTQLRSLSPGTLVHWIIPNAGHVDTGQAFAEIEQPGSPIATGEILAVLELDDISQQVLNRAVNGSEQAHPVASLLLACLDVIHRPKLPVLHTAQVLSSYHNRLPHGLEGKLLDLISPASTENTPFPAAELLALLATVPNQAATAPILEVVCKYEAGANAHAVAELNHLIRWFHASESPFMSGGDARSVLARSANVQKLYTALHQLAKLGGAAAISVTAKAKGARHEPDQLALFSIFDMLPSLFYKHDVPAVDRLIALDMYVRRPYNMHHVHAVKKQDAFPVPLVEWHFQFPAHNLGTGNASAATAGGSAYDNPRTASVLDMTPMIKRGDLGPIRVGIMAAVRNAAKLQQHLPAILALFPQVKAKKLGRTEPWHALNVAVKVPAANADADTALLSLFGSLLASSTAALRLRGIRRVTMVAYRKGQYPRYFTFRKRLAFGEDATIRIIEPLHAFQLELYRTARFNLMPVATLTNRTIHVYHAVGKDNTLDSRFFVRALVRPSRLTPGAGQRSTVKYLTAEVDGIPTDTLNALKLAAERFPNTDCNPLFLNFLPGLPVSPDKWLWKLRITSAEIWFLCHPPTASAKTTTYRFFVSNVSGVIKAKWYHEVKDNRGCVSALGKGEHHLAPADWAYPNKEKVQPKRHRAHVMGTTYVYDYDYLYLVHKALAQQWARYPHLVRPAGNLVDAVELAIGEDGTMRKVTRPMGPNMCAVVAWLVEMESPECPRGWSMVLIANDITFAISSVGPQEDNVSAAASKLAPELGVPRIYVSALLGRAYWARQRGPRRVPHRAWVDPRDPALEYKYLYLTPKDYDRLRDLVTVERVVDKVTGETHMRIVDVIGIKDGLGVENLMGSGLIAGETSAAYDEIFTATLVACRSIGIGAYLVRLGQRAIQCGQLIILTGAAALNKVLGRDVYTSNLQLGGVQIMHRNGISHLTCIDPLHGVAQIIQWLSCVPAHRGAPLPILQAPISNPATVTAAHPASAFSTTASSVADGAAADAAAFQFDEADRDIRFAPTKLPYHPRHMLHGHRDELGAWVGGFFHRGSWMETADGWSKTVVVGRGRLGGVPVGAIAVKTRAVETVIPAHPANPNSAEQTVVEPPSVWTPASAYKTAQAGGRRDMLDAILKFSSYIVNALRTHPRPVFVYIVPHGELRGSAWVVLDPSVHQNGGMEMFADATARGGVLEPGGMAEIKHHKPQLLATVDRLNDACRHWKSKLAPTNAGAAVADSSKAAGDAALEKYDLDDENPAAMCVALQAQLQSCQESLLLVYHLAALKFTDLHDTPGRMKAKGAVRAVLE
ncbi:acetyl-coenzyme-A carboxylase [Blastocladiella emersonii ATCC 22665]|nr:acetyl-coenzyme-A carboxylase [Blastocladiella emersonii ATCC 22665]